MANYTPKRKYTKKNMSNTSKTAFFKEEPKVEEVKPKASKPVTKLTSKTVKKKTIVEKAVSWIKSFIK